MGDAVRGRLCVALIGAHNLASSSPGHPPDAPYAVLQFDNSEFISQSAATSAPRTQDQPRAKVAEPSEPESPSTANSDLRAEGCNESAGHAGAGHDAPVKQELASANCSPDEVRRSCDHVWDQEVRFDVAFQPDKGISTAGLLDATGRNYLSLSVYARSRPECGDTNGQTRANETLIGVVEVRLDFDKLREPNTRSFECHSLHPRGEPDQVSGHIHLRCSYQIYGSDRAVHLTDFDILRGVGRGGFGRVFQVRKRDTSRVYAMKAMRKEDQRTQRAVRRLFGERDVMQRSSPCPFLLGLKFSFQTSRAFVLVIDYKGGGDLLTHLRRVDRFFEGDARFYVAELTLALEHLHQNDIIYRDLKPENILLDANGHVVLCDFGLSKMGIVADQSTSSFCGTVEYIAPEVILGRSYGRPADFWALGVTFFELVSGIRPFAADATNRTYDRICYAKLKFPRGAFTGDGKSFLKRILNRNPQNRLDAAGIRRHPFFAPIDWDKLSARQVSPPFKPFLDADAAVLTLGSDELSDEDLKGPPRAQQELQDERSLEDQVLGFVPLENEARPADKRLGGPVRGVKNAIGLEEHFAGFSMTTHSGAREGREEPEGGAK